MDRLEQVTFPSHHVTSERPQAPLEDGFLASSPPGPSTPSCAHRVGRDRAQGSMRNSEFNEEWPSLLLSRDCIFQPKEQEIKKSFEMFTLVL